MSRLFRFRDFPLPSETNIHAYSRFTFQGAAYIAIVTRSNLFIVSTGSHDRRGYDFSTARKFDLPNVPDDAELLAITAFNNPQSQAQSSQHPPLVVAVTFGRTLLESSLKGGEFYLNIYGGNTNFDNRAAAPSAARAGSPVPSAAGGAGVAGTASASRESVEVDGVDGDGVGESLSSSRSPVPGLDDERVRLEDVFRDCQQFKLGYTPFAVTCSDCVSFGRTSFDIVVTGMDRVVHVYRQDALGLAFIEMPIDSAYPFQELLDLPSGILTLDIQYSTLTRRRVLAAGCQDGTVVFSSRPLTLHGKANKSVIGSHIVDGPVSCVRLVTLTAGTHGTAILAPSRNSTYELKLDSLKSVFRRGEDLNRPSSYAAAFGSRKVEDQTPPEICLVVCGAMGFASVYANVGEHLFDREFVLPESNMYDAVTCALAADLDFKGRNEVIIGTFGQVALVYSAVYKESAGDDECYDIERFELAARRTVSHPIYALDTIDLNDDGLDEVVVMTMYGASVLQANFKAAASRIKDVLSVLEEIQQLEGELHSRVDSDGSDG